MPPQQETRIQAQLGGTILFSPLQCQIDLQMKRCRPYYTNQTNLEKYISHYGKKQLSLQSVAEEEPEVKLTGTVGE